MAVKKLVVEKFDLEKELIFVKDSAGEQFQLALDGVIKDAVYQLDRKASAKGKTEMSPKEIQRRVRAGRTPVEIAKLTGISIDDINRFTFPIEGEKLIAIRQFQALKVSLDNPTESIEALISKYVSNFDVSLKDLAWRAYRIDDLPWHISMSISQGKLNLDAKWLWDGETKKVQPLNDDAYLLLAIDQKRADDAEDAPDSGVIAFDESVIEKYKDAEEPEEVATQPMSPDDIPVANEPVKVEVKPEASPAPAPKIAKASEPIAEESPEPTPEPAPEPEPAPQEVDEDKTVLLKPEAAKDNEPLTLSKSSRMKVPSWDEIVLGG